MNSRQHPVFAALGSLVEEQLGKARADEYFEKTDLYVTGSSSTSHGEYKVYMTKLREDLVAVGSKAPPINWVELRARLKAALGLKASPVDTFDDVYERYRDLRDFVKPIVGYLRTGHVPTWYFSSEEGDGLDLRERDAYVLSAILSACDFLKSWAQSLK
jgi:hypothetical protein